MAVMIQKSRRIVGHDVWVDPKHELIRESNNLEGVSFHSYRSGSVHTVTALKSLLKNWKRINHVTGGFPGVTRGVPVTSLLIERPFEWGES
jgi:hypothetical protein